MFDDLIAPSICGQNSIEINNSNNTLIELKKLKFHTPVENKKSKCHLVHIGKKNGICPDMILHGQVVDRVEQAVYLGDVISSDGSNTSNVHDMISKGFGPMNKIMTLWKTVSFGSNYYNCSIPQGGSAKKWDAW